MSVLDELMEVSEVSIQEILVNLLDGEKDLDLKTHILRPKELASLTILANFLEFSNINKSSELIKSFITKYLRFMVSYKRLSREEIIRAVSSLFDRDTIRMSVSEKLTTNMKK